MTASMELNDSDADLVRAVRAGDRTAMGALYERHVDQARRVASAIAAGDGEELVAQAFERVFNAIRGGRGPAENLGPYLHTTIRNLNIDRLRSQRREQPRSDQLWLFDDVEPEVEAYASADAEHAATALKSLPDRWRELLWMLEVEGHKPSTVGELWSMSPAQVSAMAYRAREGLRQAYLIEHVPPAANDQCRWVRDNLGKYVRGTLTPRRTAKIDRHVDLCEVCAAALAEIEQLNTRLGAIWWPVVLVGAMGAPKVAGLAAGGGVAAGAGSAAGAGAGPSPGRSGPLHSSAGLASTAIVSIIVIVAAVALVTGAMGPDDSSPGAIAATPPAETQPNAPNAGPTEADPLAETSPVRPPVPAEDADTSEAQPWLAGRESEVSPEASPPTPPAPAAPPAASSERPPAAGPDPEPEATPPPEPEPEPPVDERFISLTPGSPPQAGTYTLTLTITREVTVHGQNEDVWDCGETLPADGETVFVDDVIVCVYVHPEGGGEVPAFEMSIRPGEGTFATYRFDDPGP